jgi:hypothetical protein
MDDTTTNTEGGAVGIAARTESKSAAVAMNLKDGISNVEFQHLEFVALTLCEKDAVSSRELGAALIKVRDACAAHGDFTKWMQAHKVDRNRVNYCVRLVEGKVTKAKGRSALPTTESVHRSSSADAQHRESGSRSNPPLPQWVAEQLIAFDTTGALLANPAELVAQLGRDECRNVARALRPLIPWLKEFSEALAGRKVQRGNQKKMSQAVGGTEDDPRQMPLWPPSGAGRVA